AHGLDFELRRADAPADQRSVAAQALDKALSGTPDHRLGLRLSNASLFVVSFADDESSVFAGEKVRRIAVQYGVHDRPEVGCGIDLRGAHDTLSHDLDQILGGSV